MYSHSAILSLILALDPAAYPRGKLHPEGKVWICSENLSPHTGIRSPGQTGLQKTCKFYSEHCMMDGVQMLGSFKLASQGISVM